jgi:hypothetical protein
MYENKPTKTGNKRTSKQRWRTKVNVPINDMYNINRTHMILNGTIHNVYKNNRNKIVKKNLSINENKTKRTGS